MNRLALGAATLAVVLVFANAVSAQDADPERRAAQLAAGLELAAGLAADTADARQSAEDALVALGETARPIAEARLEDPDAEIRRRARSILARLDSALASTSRAALTWAGLRGDAGRSGVAGGPIPLEDPERIWSVHVPRTDLIQGALVPGHDRVMALSGDGIVRCFAAADGERLWLTSIDAKISASAVLAAGRLVIPSSRGIVALDERTGRAAWERPAAYGCDAAPAVSGGRVFAAFRNEGVRAFDLDTGEVVFESAFAPSGALLVDGDLIVVGTEDGRVMRLDPETGKRRWSVEIGTAPNMGPTLVAPGMIAVLARSRYLRVLGTERGSLLWERRLRAASSSESLAASAGRMFLTDDTGSLRAYDVGTGHPIWQRSEGMLETGGPCATSESVLWAARGRLTCRNADDGRLRWRLDLPALNSPPPVVRGGVIYVLTDRELIALR